MKAILKNKKPQNKKNYFASILGYVKTLFSNQACIDRGTGKSTIDGSQVGVKKTWYIAIIFFIVAIFAAMTPLTVQNSKINGSNLLSGSTYGYNEAITSAALFDEASSSTQSYVKVSGTLDDVKFNKENKTFTITSGMSPKQTASGYDYYYLGYHKSIHTDSTTGVSSYVKDFDFYYVTKDNLTKALTDLAKYTTKFDGTNLSEGSESFINRNCSYLLISEKLMYTSKYSYSLSKTISSIYGDYEYLNLENNTSIATYFTQNVDKTAEIEAQNAVVIKNYKSFLDKTYQNLKTKNLWIQSGIVLGIDGGLTLLLGLVVFLMTRGKNNPNRVIKWYQCFLIVFYASLCPGLLSLILGFMISNMAMMLYVVTFGVRVMWMSVKSLRPTYN